LPSRLLWHLERLVLAVGWHLCTAQWLRPLLPLMIDLWELGLLPIPRSWPVDLRRFAVVRVVFNRDMDPYWLTGHDLVEVLHRVDRRTFWDACRLHEVHQVVGFVLVGGVTFPLVNPQLTVVVLAIGFWHCLVQIVADNQVELD